jgi:bd-type cytochrome oxidase subunit I
MHGCHRTSAVADSVRLHHLVEYHLSRLHDGLEAWLTVLEALHLYTGRHRVTFEFWLKIFGVAFGLGVVSGVVMAFQSGTNWSVLSKMSGPIEGAPRLRDIHSLRWKRVSSGADFWSLSRIFLIRRWRTRRAADRAPFAARSSRPPANAFARFRSTQRY